MITLNGNRYENEIISDSMLVEPTRVSDHSSHVLKHPESSVLNCDGLVLCQR